MICSRGCSPKAHDRTNFGGLVAFQSYVETAPLKTNVRHWIWPLLDSNDYIIADYREFKGMNDLTLTARNSEVTRQQSGSSI